MSRRIDLHTHSIHSDGTQTPAKVVRIAFDHGVEAMILTDHDSVSGCEEGRKEAEKLGLRFGCGIEINTREDDMVHVLGYGIDPGSETLTAHLKDYRRRRQGRAGRIVERLQEAGIDITLEEVRGRSEETLGRPHIADVLIRKGVVRSRPEAFRKYLAKGAAAFIEQQGPTVEEAIAIIIEAGGWACLAHPFTTAYDGRLEAWVKAGLEGIEAYYMSHTRPQVARLEEAARRFGLRRTGGSDYHGPRTGRETPGGVEVPDEIFKKIEGLLGLSEPNA